MEVEQSVTSEENIELFNTLIEKAKKGKHAEIELISSFKMLRVVYIFRNANRKVAKAFKKSAKNNYKYYLTELKHGYSAVDYLILAQTLDQAATFYKEEAKLYNYMIEEFDLYLAEGHFWSLLLGNERTEDEMIDYHTFRYNLKGDIVYDKK